MNLYDYVQNYNYTFSEKPFNELDNLVFALLSYLDFYGMVSNNKKDKITIEELAKIYFTKYPKSNFKENITAKRMTFKMFKLLIDNKRYKDVLVYNYEFLHDDNMQYGAVTFEFGDTIYISFEGTDDYISGWKEDCELSYHYPVAAHEKAISYLNSYLFTNKKIIVGGHSKGGNLALVASMNSIFLVRNKIINIYSNDGPGLRLSEFQSKKYLKVRDKLIHIIPNSSLVGILLRHENDIVVKANGVIGYTHSPFTWQIKDTELVRTELSKMSRVIDKGLISWLDKYSYEQRELFVESFFKVFEENNIYSLNQFKMNLLIIIDFLKSLTKVDGIVKEMSSDLINILKACLKEN